MVGALVAGLLPGAAGAQAAATMPAGFQETIAISGLNYPTVVRFANDGRVFVAEKFGRIKVFDNLSDTTPSVIADLSSQVLDYWDRGLLGMTIPPDITANPYIYVLYSRDAKPGGGQWNDTCPNPPGATADGCVITGRLSRLPLTPTGTGAEQVLIEDWCQQYHSHSVGNIEFGADGALYVTAGDGASSSFADYGQDGSPLNPCGDPPGGVGATLTPPTAEGGALRSQDLRTTGDPLGLDGTVIRVDPATGRGLPGNPFYDPATGGTTNIERVIAYGLRNPFRLTTRPGTSEVWISDVGWSTWEELNRIVAPTDAVAENFGWPCFEGGGRQATYDNLNLNLCETLYTSGDVATPYYAYRHSDQIVAGEACNNGQGSSTVGMAFYRGGNYPAAYDGALFFADYSRNCLWVMQRGTNGLPDPSTRTNFVTPAASPVHLEIGPNGDLFYVDLTGGTIRRIQYTSTTNNPPVAAATATPTSGQVPLTVQFSGSGSSDPDGDALTYAWDLDGDGAFDDGSGVTASHTYTTAGTFTARLRVTDARGASATSSPLTITAGTPPTVTIDEPSPATWAVGDDITISGSATDANGQPIPATGLQWQVNLMHCPFTLSDCHAHPIQTVTGSSVTIDGPDHEYPAYLLARLTATDGGGLSSSAERNIYPRTVDVTFASDPAGLTLAAVGVTQAAPFTKELIVGSKTSISAPDPQDRNGVRYAFQSWSDGGSRSHDYTVGTAAATLTATFAPISADLAASQQGSASGGTASFAVTATNLAGTAASGVVLEDTLNAKLTYVSASSSACSYTAATRIVRCVVGNLAVGASTTFTITARYRGKATVDNVLTVTSSTADVNATNNTSRLSLKLR